MDGNEAAAYVSYAFTEVATIYPITPSSPMAEHVREFDTSKLKRILQSLETGLFFCQIFVFII